MAPAMLPPAAFAPAPAPAPPRAPRLSLSTATTASTDASDASGADLAGAGAGADDDEDEDGALGAAAAAALAAQQWGAPLWVSGMDFSALFNDPFLSDFDLALVAADGGRELARFPVHGAVLAGQSPYFKALLQNWTGSSQREIALKVQSAAERAAAEAMLRCAYSGAAPAGAAPEELLATMVLADRYQLRHCVEVCRRAILATDASRMSWQAVLALLHLPPGLQEVEAFGSLAEKAHQRVWQDFGNLDAAFQRAPLRRAFLQLPRAAVERLVAADALRAVSENAVYLAVSSWLRARLRDASGGGGGASGSGGGSGARLRQPGQSLSR